jgi:VWFA-related protein
VRPPAEGRAFYVFFDDAHVTATPSEYVRVALRRFIQTELREGDWITVMAPQQGLWWTARNSWEYRQLDAVVDRLKGQYVRDPGAKFGMSGLSDFQAMCIVEGLPSEMCGVRPMSGADVGAPAASGGGGGGSGGGGSGGRATGGGSGSSSGGSADRVLGVGRSNTDFLAEEVYARARRRLDLTFVGLRQALDSLVPLRGHKSLLLISEGFVLVPDMPGYREIVETARRANVALHFFDPRGLESGYGEEEPPGLGWATKRLLDAAGGDDLAQATGGRTIVSNDPGEGLRRIAAESEAYYLLGYQPRNAARDGKFRKIEVKVARRGVDVRARRGYYAPGPVPAATEAKAGGRDEAIQAALDSPYDVEGIPLRATSFVFEETSLGKATVVIAADVDVRGLAFEKQGERLEDALEFLLVVAHRETGEFHRYDQTVELKLQRESLDRYARTWFPLRRDFELAPGGYQAKIVVRDRRSRKLGSVVHDFRVPPTDALRVSTPVLSDEVEPRSTSEPGPPVPVLRVDRTFPARGILYLQYSVFGAARNPTGDGLPRVRAEHVVRRSDGVVLSRARRSIILPTSLGEVSRVSGMPLDGAAPGEYELLLQVEDEITGEGVEVRERFRVVAVEGP